MPLHLDVGGEVLLIATNVGRNTFGLRGLNLRTGLLEDLETFHERFDLIEPTVLVAAEASCMRAPRF